MAKRENFLHNWSLFQIFYLDFWTAVSVFCPVVLAKD